VSEDTTTYKWGDVVELQYGKSLKKDKRQGGPTRVYGSNGPIGWTDHKPQQTGPCVILGRKGAYRGVEYWDGPVWVIDTAYRVVPKKDTIDMRWLYYAVKAYGLGEIDDGSPIPSTTRAAVYIRDVFIPPLAEQKRIAHILGSFDDKIELNRKMNETLEAMAQALFKDWFVDFGPTRAKMEGKEPYLAPEIWELFPDKLGDDGVPEGWRERRLDEFFPVITGKKNANFADSEGVYPFFTCAIEQTLYTNSYSFDADAILLAGNGNFNVKWYRGKFEAYQRTYVLIPYKSQLLSILHALMQYFLNDLVVGHKGSVINYLTKGMITGYSITLPNDEVLCKLSPSFNKLYRLYERSLREGKALEAMRDALLNKIF